MAFMAITMGLGLLFYILLGLRYRLNSFKVRRVGDAIGSFIGVIKGDTRSLDHNLYSGDSPAVR